MADVAVKVAETLRATLMLTVQVLEAPEHAPPQLVKVEPVPAVAVRVTLVPVV